MVNIKLFFKHLYLYYIYIILLQGPDQPKARLVLVTLALALALALDPFEPIYLIRMGQLFGGSLLWRSITT